MENKPASLFVVPLGKALSLAGFPHLGVVDRWPATVSELLQRFDRFLVIGG